MLGAWISTDGNEPIKVGDRVECVTGERETLTRGQVYTVENVCRDAISVTNDYGLHFWYPEKHFKREYDLEADRCQRK